LLRAVREINEQRTFTFAERSGAAVARLVPVPGATAGSVREALAAWRSAGTSDPEFGELLERVAATDRPPDDAWAS
jgi:hypothetical protein